MAKYCSKAEDKGKSVCLSLKDWDRRRRCDLFDYDPPCGICEGYGGVPYGDENDQIDLSRYMVAGWL